jgi:hypothetical protein
MRSLQPLFLSILVAALAMGRAYGASPESFRVWVFSDAHVGTDKTNGRDSLATAIQQSEGPNGFDWDIALDLGDMSGSQGTPKDEEGQEIVRQFGVLKHHRREQIYDLSGNHDRSGLDDGTPQNQVPRSWLLTFTQGSDRVTARCYLHGNEFAPQGWYARSDQVIKLSKPFKR